MLDDEQMMATGNMHGDVALWDLSERRLAHIMKSAHDGYITSLTFLNNQPILVTGATDNSIKVKKKYKRREKQMEEKLLTVFVTLAMDL